MGINGSLSLHDEFPILKNWTYLDSAVLGPIPQRTVLAMEQALLQQAALGSIALPKINADVERTRERFACLVGAKPTEISFAQNNTQALSTISNGINWNEGDSVVIGDIEFSANALPWFNLSHRGVQVRQVQSSGGHILEESLLQACDATTQVVAISAVQFLSGYRADLAWLGEACRKREILFVVDGMQAIGALSLHVNDIPVDVLTTASHKWLLGPPGVGWLFVREEVVDRIRPTNVGSRSVENKSYFDRTLNFRKGAHRFDTGVPNLPGILATGTSLELLCHIGVETIERSILELTGYAEDRLQTKNYKILDPRRNQYERSGIVTFRHPKLSNCECMKRLIENRVAISERESWLRISLHFFNTAGDVDRLLEALDDQ